RPWTEQQLTVAATKGGTLTAIRHVTAQSTSFVGDWMEPCGNSTSQVMYACPNVQIVHRLAHLNIGSPTFMRGPGETPGTFALESALDELAGALGLDPVELRVRNHTSVNPASGKPWSSNYPKECYALVAEKFGWGRRTPQPRPTPCGSRLTSSIGPTRTSTRSAVEGSASCRSPVSPLPSPTPSTTPPASAPATCRSPRTNCCSGAPLE